MNPITKDQVERLRELARDKCSIHTEEQALEKDLICTYANVLKPQLRSLLDAAEALLEARKLITSIAKEGFWSSLNRTHDLIMILDEHKDAADEYLRKYPGGGE